MQSGHECTATGRADGVDIVVVQDDPRVGQRIQVGRGDLIRAVEAHVVPALVETWPLWNSKHSVARLSRPMIVLRNCTLY